MPSWPNTLPERPQRDGYQEKLTDQTLESRTEQGPVKIRRRFTGAYRTLSVRMLMTTSQVSTFEAFWQSTLQGGSLPFTWVNPRTGDSGTFRFRNPAPTYSPNGYDSYDVSFVVEQL